MFRDECGVFGVWNHPQASRLSYLGLYAMQHRGQESAGIISLERGVQHAKKGLGLVSDVFDDESLNLLPGSAAIGHVRYSTTGMNSINNAQPLTAQLFNGPVAVGHNGNIVNADILKAELKSQRFDGAGLRRFSRRDSHEELKARAWSRAWLQAARDAL